MTRYRSASPLWGALVAVLVGAQLACAAGNGWSPATAEAHAATAWGAGALASSATDGAALAAGDFGLGARLLRSAPKITRRLGLFGDGDEDDPCALATQTKYNCTESGCDDLVPGELGWRTPVGG